MTLKPLCAEIFSSILQDAFNWVPSGVGRQPQNNQRAQHFVQLLMRLIHWWIWSAWHQVHVRFFWEDFFSVWGGKFTFYGRFGIAVCCIFWSSWPNTLQDRFGTWLANFLKQDRNVKTEPRISAFVGIWVMDRPYALFFSTFRGFFFETG